MAENGNMFNYLKNLQSPLTAKEISVIYYKITQAVQAIHNLGMVHRDLKPENILLTKDLDPKVSDFGWSVEIGQNEKRGTFCGTYEYMAPEIFENERYNVSVDIWSLGVLLYEMFHGYSPFSSKSVFKIYRNIVEEEINFKDNMDEDAKDLIKIILKNNPQQRPKLEEILNHRFITLYNKSSNNLGCIQISEFLNKNKKTEKIKEIENLKTKRNKIKQSEPKKVKKPNILNKKKNVDSSNKLINKIHSNSNSHIYKGINKNLSDKKMNLSISIDSYDSEEAQKKIATINGEDDSSQNCSQNKIDSKKSLYELKIKKNKKMNSSGYMKFQTLQSNKIDKKLSQGNSKQNLKLESKKLIKGPIKNKINESINNKQVFKQLNKNTNKSLINNVIESNYIVNSERCNNKNIKITNLHKKELIYSDNKNKPKKKNVTEKNIKTIKNNEFGDGARNLENSESKIEEESKNGKMYFFKNFIKKKTRKNIPKISEIKKEEKNRKKSLIEEDYQPGLFSKKKNNIKIIINKFYDKSTHVYKGNNDITKDT